MADTIKIKQVRSTNGCKQDQVRTGPVPSVSTGSARFARLLTTKSRPAA